MKIPLPALLDSGMPYYLVSEPGIVGTQKYIKTYLVSDSLSMPSAILDWIRLPADSSSASEFENLLEDVLYAHTFLHSLRLILCLSSLVVLYGFVDAGKGLIDKTSDRFA